MSHNPEEAVPQGVHHQFFGHLTMLCCQNQALSMAKTSSHFHSLSPHEEHYGIDLRHDSQKLAVTHVQLGHL
jgi:hypothetical protein